MVKGKSSELFIMDIVDILVYRSRSISFLRKSGFFKL